MKISCHQVVGITEKVVKVDETLGYDVVLTQEAVNGLLTIIGQTSHCDRMGLGITKEASKELSVLYHILNPHDGRK
jgi:hypothetical protein